MLDTHKLRVSQFEDDDDTLVWIDVYQGADGPAYLALSRHEAIELVHEILGILRVAK